MGLMVRWDEVPDSTPIAKEDLKGGEISTKRLYGVDSSITVAMRSAGYHSRPHIHNCEQLNYLAEGELWIFVEEKGYLLRRGDFFRVPYGAVHWAWNRGETRSVLIESHTPALIGKPSVRAKSVGLFHQNEPGVPRAMPQTIFLSDDITKAVEARYVNGEGERSRSLLARGDEVPSGRQLVNVLGGGMSTYFVYGNDGNLMVATRVAGYHSRPHVHDCEQLNYLQSGELWVFVEDELYKLKAGDFLRIPTMAVHWAWNRGQQPSVLVEIHTPCLDPYRRQGATGLFGPTETPALRTPARTIMVADEYMKVEARYL